MEVIRLDTTNAHDEVCETIGSAWPEFMHHDPVCNRLWGTLYDVHRATQAVAFDDGQAVLVVHSIPFSWDGTIDGLPPGFDHGLDLADRQHAEGIEPNTLMALAVVIDPARRGQGLATVGVQVLRDLAIANGFGAVIACVRPNLKWRYPLIDIAEYVRWTTPTGEPFDPWMRVHHRAGATIARPAPEAMHIPGTVAQWEEWAGMVFPGSGAHIVPNALVPVHVDRDADVVTYTEPNCWMVHRLERQS